MTMLERMVNACRRARVPRALALAWLLPAASIVVTVGWLGLITPTETRYAEIAREMVMHGDWLVPRIEGMPHLDKPPIAYWASAAGQIVLGPTEWGARLGVALASAFILWGTAGIARMVPRAHPRTPVLAAPVLASTALFFIFSRQLASDIFLVAGVVAFHRAYLDVRYRSTVWPFVALGACFMAKGPVGFIMTAIPVALAGAWVRDPAAVRPLASARGWLVFAAVAFPWYLLVVAQAPERLGWFLYDLWQRYTTTAHHRAGPVYYFVPVMVAGALPWTWAMLHGAWRAARQVRRRDDFVRAVLVTWVVVPLVFFTTSRSKLPAYVLPVFPALAVLAALALLPARRAVAIATSLTALGMAAAVAIAGSGSLPTVMNVGIALTSGVRLHASAAGLALAFGAVMLLRRRALTGAALVLVSLLVVLHAARSADDVIGSPRALIEALREHRAVDEPVVEYGKLSTGLDFYLAEDHHHIDVLPHARTGQAPAGRGFVGVEWLVGQLASARRIWVIGPEGPVTDLATTLRARATVVAREREHALIALDARAAAPGAPAN